ncbi:MAG: hypothetical protein ACOYNF_18035, partial [Rhodoferax sp.]
HEDCLWQHQGLDCGELLAMKAPCRRSSATMRVTGGRPTLNDFIFQFSFLVFPIDPTHETSGEQHVH